MLRRPTAPILASTYVIALVSMTGSCLIERPTRPASALVVPAIPVQAPKAPASPATAPVVVDENWCGEVIRDRDTLHALVEARIAEHSAAFAACAPAQRERIVVRVEIMLNVCGRASLGTPTPNIPFTVTEQCIGRVLATVPFASIGDMNFWHSHEFVFEEKQ